MWGSPGNSSLSDRRGGQPSCRCLCTLPPPPPRPHFSWAGKGICQVMLMELWKHCWQFRLFPASAFLNDLTSPWGEEEGYACFSSPLKICRARGLG